MGSTPTICVFLLQHAHKNKNKFLVAQCHKQLSFMNVKKSANLCTARPLLCFIKQKIWQEIFCHFLKMDHLVPAGDKEEVPKYSVQKR